MRNNKMYNNNNNHHNLLINKILSPTCEDKTTCLTALQGLPTSGLQALYGGGGYVADLGTSRRKADRLIFQLNATDWIDVYTRAVFIEFTVYNPNVNLFAYINLLTEFTSTGEAISK